MGKVLLAFIVGLMMMAGAEYWWMHHRYNDSLVAVEDRGFGRKTVTIGVGEVIHDIRSLNRLVVFQAYITATTTSHDIGWFTQSDQTMLTPAYVNYFIDLGTIQPKSLRVNGNEVFVTLPALMIERPNIDTLNIQTFDAGIWSHLSSTSDRLRVKNSRMALGQLFQQAKTRFLVEAAKRAAVATVAANIQTELSNSGRPAIQVHVIPAP